MLFFTRLVIGSLLSYLAFYIVNKTKFISVDLYNELRSKLSDSQIAYTIEQERVSASNST